MRECKKHLTSIDNLMEQFKLSVYTFREDPAKERAFRGTKTQISKTTIQNTKKTQIKTQYTLKTRKNPSFCYFGYFDKFV